ncbi:MAG: DNA-3-methyladenine glycosylase family protein [Actinocrinis sp.]
MSSQGTASAASGGNDEGKATAYRFLSRVDPVLARLVGEFGTPDPFGWIGGSRTGEGKFAAMVLHIVGQQISTAVAFVLYDRVAEAAAGEITPASIAALDPIVLRACGLSRAKVDYVQALAEAELSGALDIENADTCADDEVVARLTGVRGIGLWTSQMFLIHQLKRSDVLPAGDIGIRRAIERQWSLDKVPSIIDVQQRGALWTPHRTHAAALLWASLGAAPA